MCVSIPFKLISIEGNEALGQVRGMKKKIRIDLIEDVKVGDFVLVHAGFAINKIDKEYAEETLVYFDKILTMDNA